MTLPRSRPDRTVAASILILTESRFSFKRSKSGSIFLSLLPVLSGFDYSQCRDVREVLAVSAAIGRSDPTDPIHERRIKMMRILLLFLGFLSAILIIGQLVMGLMILNGNTSMVKGHQHSGFLTVAVTLFYIAWSLIAVASSPRRDGV